MEPYTATITVTESIRITSPIDQPRVRVPRYGTLIVSHIDPHITEINMIHSDPIFSDGVIGPQLRCLVINGLHSDSNIPPTVENLVINSLKGVCPSMPVIANPNLYLNAHNFRNVDIGRVHYAFDSKSICDHLQKNKYTITSCLFEGVVVGFNFWACVRVPKVHTQRPSLKQDQSQDQTMTDTEIELAYLRLKQTRIQKRIDEITQA